MRSFLSTSIGICCLAWAFVAGPAGAAPADVEPAGVQDPGLKAQILSHLTQARQRFGQGATDLITRSLQLIGVPYRRGGESADTGFDCSGFVRHLYEESFGQLLPRRADEQARSTETIARDELQPGDLVFFNTMRRTFSHVGIYLGEGKFIHAPSKGKKVEISDMRAAYWNKRFTGARRVTPEPQVQGAVSR
ncbi:MAG: C40 family peptidase [Limnohabitans sp.]